MTTLELRTVVRKCNFLLGWQKSRLESMLADNCDDSDEDAEDCLFNSSFLSRRSPLLGVIDHVFWRTIGVGIDDLPVEDQQSIKYAVQEVSR